MKPHMSVIDEIIRVFMNKTSNLKTKTGVAHFQISGFSSRLPKDTKLTAFYTVTSGEVDLLFESHKEPKIYRSYAIQDARLKDCEELLDTAIEQLFRLSTFPNQRRKSDN